MITHDQTYHFDLTGFLNRLKQEGFFIGVDTHLSVQKIMAVLPSDSGKVEVSALLMPLLCKSPKQQVTFKVVFQQFWRENLTLKRRDEKPLTDSPTAPQPITPKSKNPLNQWLKNLQIWFKKYAEQFTNWLNKNREQKVVAKKEKGIPPDKYRDLFAEAPPVTMPEVLTKAVARLRTREPLGIHQLDIEKTIEKSIKNIGTFTPVYTSYTRYTEYLILIQADNPDDHKARLYNSFFEEMQYRNIPVVRYYFRSNPLICYDEHHSEGIELPDLLRQQSNAVLIVFAQLHTFLSPRNDEPFKWVHQLARLPFRCLFLPFNSELEAHLSLRLDDIFDCVLPATDIGVEQLETYLQNPDKSISLHQFATTQNTFPIQIDSEEDINQLPTLLPPHLLKWIAACAIYPDFSWKMTLFLGEALSTEAGVYNTWENIRQLARVSCFKEAYMPQYVRRYILDTKKNDWISQDDTQLVRQSILQQMHHNQVNNFLPADFLSRIYFEPKNKEEKAILKSHLEEEVDYITATLINSDRFKDVLLFDLEVLDRFGDLVKDVAPIIETDVTPEPSKVLIDDLGLEDDATIKDDSKQEEIYEEEPIKVFVSYSIKDVSYLEKLRTHLKPLEKDYNIKIQYTGMHIVGSNWSKGVKKLLNSADIVLLLLSVDSLTSNYFLEEEMEDVLIRHELKETILIPIILRHCSWEDTYLYKFQALPKDAKPITAWRDESAAYHSIFRGIADNVNLIKQRNLEKTKSDDARINELLTLINTDIDAALDVLDDIFGNSNDTYNHLSGEFLVRAFNFDMDTHRSKLKSFVQAEKDFIQFFLNNNLNTEGAKVKFGEVTVIEKRKKEIEHAIMLSNIKKAIKLTIDFSRDFNLNYEKEVISISANYHRLTEKLIDASFNPETHTSNTNKIIASLLEISFKIEKEYKQGNLDKQKSKIIDVIRKGEIRKAIELLMEMASVIKNEDFKRSILFISYDYEKLKKDEIRGLLSHDEYNINKAQIIDRIVNILIGVNIVNNERPSIIEKSPKQPELRDIYNLIENGQIEKAISLAINYSQPDTTLRNDLIVISVQYAALKRAYKQGSLNDENYNAMENEIATKLLQILLQMQNEIA